MSASGIVALPSGNGGTASQSIAASVLQVPHSCTATGLQVTQFGAAGTSTVLVILGVGSPSNVAGNVLSGTNLQCTLTAASGGFSSCTSGGPTALTAGQDISMALISFSNPSDYQNARILASFVCQ